MTFQEMIDMQNRLARLLSFSYIEPMQPPILIDPASNMRDVLEGLYPQVDYSAITASLEIFDRLSHQSFEFWPGDTETLDPDVSHLLLDAATNAVTAAKTCLNPETSEKCEKAIVPLTEGKAQKRLSFSDFLAIVNILLMIFFELMPDEPVIVQIDTSIRQDTECVCSLNKESEERIRAENLLADCLNLFARSIDLPDGGYEILNDSSEITEGTTYSPC